MAYFQLMYVYEVVDFFIFLRATKCTYCNVWIYVYTYMQ